MSATDLKAPETLDEALLARDFLLDPYPVYARLRDEDPVHWMEAWNAWVITRYDDASSVLREDGRKFSAAGRVGLALRVLPDEIRAELGVMDQHFSTGIAFTDPPIHTHIRGVLNKAFSPGTIEAMRPRIERCVDALLDAADDRNEMDVVADFAFPVPGTIIAEVLGLPLERLTEFKAWSDDLASFFGSNRQTPDLARRGREALVHLRDLMGGLAEERRRSPRDDVIGRLIEAERTGEGLSEAEFLPTAVTFAVGGHKTTTALISSGIWWLLRQPDQLRRLKAEPSLLTSAVEEFLRLESPAQRVTKIANQDVEIGGRSIREGQLVMLLVGAANRDPDAFAEPDRLDIARSPNRHLAFSLGRHFCIGANLARLEAAIAIGALLGRYPDMRPLSEASLWNPNPTFRALRSLPVILM